MEKIYEENSSQRRKKNSISIVLSFVVAIFAIVSLIAVGFNQISFAAEEETKTLQVKFGQIVNTATGGSDKEQAFIVDQTSTLHVPMMFTDSDDALTAQEPIFCVEFGKDAQQGVDYSYEGTADNGEPDKTINDFGLVYLLNRSGVLGGPGIVNNIDNLTYPSNTSQKLSEFDKKALETYATQIAIWEYLRQTATGDRKGNFTDIPASALTGSVDLISPQNSVRHMYTGNLYENGGIKSAVDAAKVATNAKTVQANLASTSIGLVGDKTIYQTDKITVTANPSKDLLGYYVDLYNLDGAYIVDKDGKTRDALYKFNPGDYFYIRVPVNKITDKNKEVKFRITGEFTNYAGGEFYGVSGTETQEVVKVSHENYRTWNEASINFSVVPPTGMTTAQTIYFIGLIVLLCGVGIIYANAKPVEEK